MFICFCILLSSYSMWLGTMEGRDFGGTFGKDVSTGRCRLVFPQPEKKFWRQKKAWDFPGKKMPRKEIRKQWLLLCILGLNCWSGNSALSWSDLLCLLFVSWPEKNYAKKVRRERKNIWFFFREETMSGTDKKEKKDFFLPSSFSFPRKKFGKQTEEGEEHKTAE